MGGEDVTPKAAKQRALLALLLLHANEPVAADQLVEQLWEGKPPATAQNTLQRYVSELRKLLPAETLLTQAPGYVLRVEPEQIDLLRFERTAEEGRQALEREDARQAAELLEHALALWRGPALADFAYESWAAQEAQRLEEQRLDVLENQIEARLALGRHGELVAELQTLVAQQPMRDRLRRQLMLALYRAGRQAEALEAYRQARETLVEELGIDPSPALQALYKQILNQDERLAGPSVPAKPRTTNLPESPTPLIGRERELQELRELLSRTDVRLVTVTGAGGSGKTRLSLELARGLLAGFAEGVFMVELAPISDPELLVPSVAQALGVRERPDEQLEQTLTNHLFDRDLLLLLDNFEQLLGAAPKLAELLAHTPRLRVVVTSRAVLHLAAEHEYPLSPLSLPDLEQLPALKTLARNEAVQLFIERARSVTPDFQITDDNAAAVAEICIRLDGLPLAIELAAARARTLSPKALLKRLDQRLALLTGGARDLPSRQQTLRGALDWSYSLLSKAEQTLFARLSIFIGGCRIEAAEAVCNPEADLGPDLLDRLEGLNQQSLLRQTEDPDGEPRFWMLQTIREYAEDRLEQMGATEQLLLSRSQYFLQVAEEADEELREGIDQIRIATLEAERANFNAALDWSDQGPATDLSLRLANALAYFWWIRGYISAGRLWFERFLLRGRVTPPREHARCLDGASYFAYIQGDYPHARERAQESLRLWRELGDADGTIRALNQLVMVTSEFEHARAIAEEAISLARGCGDIGWISTLLANLAEVALHDSNLAAAETLFNEALSQAREAEYELGVPHALLGLGETALAQRRPEHAQEAFAAALTIASALSHRILIHECLRGLAHVSELYGEPDRAACLLGAADTLDEDRSLQGSLGNTEEMLRLESEIRTNRIPELTAGGVMTLAEAIEFALEAPTPSLGSRGPSSA